MALVPIIQPPIIKLLTTKAERQVKMTQARTVSQKEKIIFPIMVTIFVSLLVPSATTLVGCLMLGNLVREIKIVPKIVENLQQVVMFCITIILGLTVGAKANGDLFLSATTLKIIALGLIAFAAGTAGGVLMGKVMYYLSGNKVNPMIVAKGIFFINEMTHNPIKKSFTLIGTGYAKTAQAISKVRTGSNHIILRIHDGTSII